MLALFLAIQLGLNVVLVAAVFLLLRERVLVARRTALREDRLEALAAEFCALGRAVAVAAEGPGVPDSPVRGSAASIPGPDRGTPAEAPPGGVCSAEPGDRFKDAAVFLDQGLPIAAVVAKTAMPEGEVQVLKNLRRSQKPTGVRGRRAPTSRKPQVVGNA
ncbi:MAG TPA: hypothetical protein VLT62_30105 [Candidatus Methylomirabilis sp.]|nr:hypothetical protein [Candidatus Methylomirabilis sp.]